MYPLPTIEKKVELSNPFIAFAVRPVDCCSLVVWKKWRTSPVRVERIIKKACLKFIIPFRYIADSSTETEH